MVVLDYSELAKVAEAIESAAQGTAARTAPPRRASSSASGSLFFMGMKVAKPTEGEDIKEID